MKTPVALPCRRCGQTCDAIVVHDPGVHSFPNGDPGYPPSDDVEWYGGCACDWSDDEVDLMVADAFQAAEAINAA